MSLLSVYFLCSLFPHLRQNFDPAGTRSPQLLQYTAAGTLLPQLKQKFAPAGIFAPQLLQFVHCPFPLVSGSLCFGVLS